MTASDRLAEAARALYAAAKDLLDADWGNCGHMASRTLHKRKVLEAVLLDSHPAITAYESEARAAPPDSDGVRVPKSVLRDWSRRLFEDGKNYEASSYKRCFANLVDVGNEMVALLPKPAAKEPPKELLEEWERKATAYADEQFGGTPSAHRAAEYGYLAALRGAWEAETKGGA